jgi:hypothetical protein
MKKIVKSIAVVLVILFLILYAYIKNIEYKKHIVFTGLVFKEYTEYRDSTKLVIKAYKDSLNVLRSKK